MRDIKSVKTQKDRNSLCEWYRIKNPLRVTFNFAIIYICRIMPSLSLKRALLRLTGMRIGKDTSIGLFAMFDIFFPELIEIGDNCIIGYNATILCHEFLIDEYRTGKVRIGNNVMLGANSTILCGVKIGDNASVSAMSLVNGDIEPGSFYGGVPAKEIKYT